MMGEGELGEGGGGCGLHMCVSFCRYSFLTIFTMSYKQFFTKFGLWGSVGKLRAHFKSWIK